MNKLSFFMIAGILIISGCIDSGSVENCPQYDAPADLKLTKMDEKWVLTESNFNKITFKEKWEVDYLGGRISCRTGEREGENINYMYCGEFGILDPTIKKQYINETGEIVGTDIKFLQFVFEPKDNDFVFKEVRCTE